MLRTVCSSLPARSTDTHTIDPKERKNKTLLPKQKQKLAINTIKTLYKYI